MAGLNNRPAFQTPSMAPEEMSKKIRVARINLDFVSGDFKSLGNSDVANEITQITQRLYEIQQELGA
jgi:hypothetical protein